MQPPDAARQNLVSQWLEKADRDYEAAEHLIAQAGRFREVVALHCQQSVEKYLKAYLVWRQIEFPKTHDIRKLLILAAAVQQGLFDSLADADILTPFGVELRYPGEAPEVLPGEEETAVDIARRARTIVRSALSNLEAD